MREVGGRGRLGDEGGCGEEEVGGKGRLQKERDPI